MKTTYILGVAAALSLGTPVLRAQAAADSAYLAARALVTSREYRRAANAFDRVVQRYPTAAHAGDALYWRAWALYQLGRDNANKPDLDDARAALERYMSNYGKSGRGASDASDLYASIRAAQAKLGDAGAAGEIAEAAGSLRHERACTSTADDEMRMAALEGLLSMSAEDAVPILKDVLKQRDSCREELRKKAVWLVAQKSGRDAVTTLLDVARNDPSTEVRGEAVFWLSQTRSEEAVPALDSILFSSRDEELRKKAIFALSQQHDDRARQALERAAEDEKLSTELRGDAIFWLGQSHTANLEYFRTLFHKTTDAELRGKIAFAVGQTRGAEATAWLLDVARDKSFDTETRKNAIFWVGQRSAVDVDQLLKLYQDAKGDDEIQRQVLFVLSQRREPAATDALMNIAKSDANIEVRKQALFWLGQKNDPRVRQFLRELISK